METVTERHGTCAVTVSELDTGDGRPVVLIKVSGAGTSTDFAHCLRRIMAPRSWPRRLMAVVDTRGSDRQTDAHGLFLQAGILAQARVKRLLLCYISDREAESAIVPMVAEIFCQSGIAADIQLCRTLEEALKWLQARP
ncbi:hypothetical protein [Rhodospira trueperi]|uniref:SpoIIAA-like n=1 Tax=Rhodospira trueperi TaxID=69960 RepID=A0A1G7AW33_9PROT|nr:hypothetical protein [Rhodospira trueperi]SDE19078.1 hypothetical protein SAMN05421720_104117 [Rhodospira trueperi]